MNFVTLAGEIEAGMLSSKRNRSISQELSMPANDIHPLLDQLRAILGKRNLITNPAATKPYRTGFRHGEGPALCVALPDNLIAYWRALEAAIAADAIIIMQAANTGLTGGSTPYGNDYDRPVVVINTRQIDRIHLIQDGRQVVCLAGATLYGLEAALKPLGRDPHSVIGSSCIGASVIGGICNNSGGALIQRGPAFTEYALYARRDADGVLRIVNELGITLEGSAETILARIEAGDFPAESISVNPARAACDHDYANRVRQIDSGLPARYNADPARLHGASGCAGKLAIFAVRLDTFPKHQSTRLFYIGANDPAILTRLRRDVLSRFENLPVSAEYLHRTCFDIAEQYGKDSFLTISLLGTHRLPQLFRIKARIDRIANRLGLGEGFSDRWLQRLSRLFSDHLPPRLKDFRDRYEHHLLLTMADEGIPEAEAYLCELLASAEGDFFACDADEAAKAALHRFAAAGAAVRYRTVHSDIVADIVALDVALPMNARDWVEKLPPHLSEQVIATLYYGHFFCHVFHQDYVLRAGCDPLAFEHAIWALLDARGAKYPAEHNVGHIYPAEAGMLAFYRALDPTNSFNPGIGGASKRRNWDEPPSCMDA